MKSRARHAWPHCAGRVAKNRQALARIWQGRLAERGREERRGRDTFSVHSFAARVQARQWIAGRDIAL